MAGGMGASQQFFSSVHNRLFCLQFDSLNLPNSNPHIKPYKFTPEPDMQAFKTALRPSLRFSAARLIASPSASSLFFAATRHLSSDIKAKIDGVRPSSTYLSSYETDSIFLA